MNLAATRLFDANILRLGGQRTGSLAAPFQANTFIHI